MTKLRYAIRLNTDLATEAPPAPIAPDVVAPTTTVTQPGQAGDDISKAIFKQSKVDLGLEAPEPPPPPLSRTEQRIAAGLEKAPPPLSHAEQSMAIFNTEKAKAAGVDQPAGPRAEAQEKGPNKSTTEIEEGWSKEAYASSPQFRAKFATREQTALELAKSSLDGTEINAEIIDLIAHANGRERVELLKEAGVDGATMQLISPHLANFDTIQREKQSALANWKTELTQLHGEAQHQAEQERAQRVQQENNVFETVLTQTDLLPLRISKDNPEWNARGDQLIAEAKQLYNGEGADLPVFAETILKGKVYDIQQQILDHVRSENASLRKENARLKSAAPGGHITAGTNDGPIDTSKMSREDGSRAIFNQEMARARGW